MLSLRGFIQREPLLTIFTVFLLLLVMVSPSSVCTALVSMDYRTVYTLLALVLPGVKIPRWKAPLSVILLFLLVPACKTLFKGLDYFLLLMFIVMFIDFTSLLLLFGLGTVGGVEAVLYGVVLPQFLGNAPATIMLVNECPDWYSLAVGVNPGGLLLVTGSFANTTWIRLGGVSVGEFQKEALPIGLLVLAAGLSYYLLVSL